METFLVSVMLKVLLIACLAVKKTTMINVNVLMGTQEFSVNYLNVIITGNKIQTENVSVNLLILENFANLLPVLVMDS
jgi:hypothetical protein